MNTGAAPRNIQFTNFAAEHGLSSEFVHDVVQDNNGYIWFATQSGLNRFDGHDVHVYESNTSDPNSLSSSFVWSLMVDSKGELWVGSERGLNRYDRVTDTFVRKPWEKLSLKDLRVRRMVEDRQGFIWLGTLGQGLLRIDPELGDAVQYKFDEAAQGSLPNDHVTALIEDSRGQLWIGTDGGGVARYDRATDTFVTYRHSEASTSSLISDRIRSIFEDKDARLWVGTAPGGVSVLDAASGRVERFEHDPNNSNSLPAGQVTALFQDERGTLWVGTESGLAEWRSNQRLFVRYSSNPAVPGSLINDRINAIMQDRSGVLWLSTLGGVSAWNHLSETFHYFGERDGYLNSDLVGAVAESADGAIWVGTYGGGLSRIDLGSDSVQHFRHDPADSGSLPEDRVMSLHVDPNDVLWVGTRSAGLARLDNASGKFRTYRHDPDDESSLSGNAITRIKTASNGALWVGVFDGGVNRMQPGASGFERFLHDPEDSGSISGNRVMSMFEDAAGVMWFGTEGRGLNRFNQESSTFDAFSLEHALAGGVADEPAGTPWELHESMDGTMWIGSLGQGLFRWSREDRAAGELRLRQFSTSQGLSSDIYGIAEGATGELWLSSNRGLIRYDPERQHTRRFDRRNGLRSNEFNQGVKLRSRSGRLFFGGTAGLVGFFPGELPVNERAPGIALSASSRTETIARAFSDAAVPHLTLDYFDAFIAFDFVALDFTSPDKNQYRYRLIGEDDNWTDVDRYRRAVYSTLAPGDYRFEVQATNNDGVWNLDGAAIELYVVPPPWSSWWAYLLYVVLALALIAWYLATQRAKRLAVIRDRERLEQLVRERTHELADRNQELTTLNDRLEQASVTDALTGLRNRRFVDQHIAAELSMLRRLIFGEDPNHENPDSPRLLFLMMIDLDGFKAINDSYGHHAGDRALLEVKDRLMACCRKSDAVVRWGGDEFLIIGHARAIEGAETFAAKIRQSIGGSLYDLGGGNQGRLSASIGLSAVPLVDKQLDFATWEQVCGIADTASYIVKKNSKDSWVSIIGTEKLSRDDVPHLKENLASLLAEGKLRVVAERLSPAELQELLNKQQFNKDD